MAVKAKKTKNPPILSHEFVIQNHADIVAVIAMVFVFGLMVDALRPLCTPFVLLQHNVSTFDNEGYEVSAVYRNGPKDLLVAFFYTLAMIIVHAVVQEFVLDKVNKKLHLSKMKFAKFNESGQLFAFYVASALYGINLLYESVLAEDFQTFISKLWTGYPDEHYTMPWSLKFFIILQISYWIHIFPELYLQKIKKEEMAPRILYASLYLVFIVAGYVMNYQRVMLLLLSMHYVVEGMFHLSRLFYFLDKKEIADIGFKLWNVLFVFTRLASVSISVLTFWFGMARVHSENPSTGSSFVVRVNALAAVCFMQAWMTWNFITFYMKRRKEEQGIVAASKKSQSKQKAKAANGAASKKAN